MIWEAQCARHCTVSQERSVLWPCALCLHATICISFTQGIERQLQSQRSQLLHVDRQGGLQSSWLVSCTDSYLHVSYWHC